MIYLFVLEDMILAENEAQLLVGSADEDHSGGIDMREFISIMTTPINPQDLEEELRATFRVFDKDGNGTINANGLKRFIRVRGKNQKFYFDYYFDLYIVMGY